MSSHSSFPRAPLRRAAGMLAVAAAATLLTIAGCGGGTTQYESFVADRLFSFGDETSALTTDAPVGRNYGINGINGNNTADDATDDFFDCALQPNWVQSLASAYGFAFAECNPDNLEVRAFNRAAPGARVAEVEAQVDAQIAAGGFRDKDVASVMVGTNDIVELYGQYDGTNEAALVAEAGARGARAARVINRLVALGAKVVASNIPDMGYTPFSAKQAATYPGEDRGGVLSRLSSAFNVQFGITVLLDGRYVGLAQIDQRILLINRAPNAYAIANTIDGACAVPPPNCTNNTLVTDANQVTFLWASDYWLGARGQQQLAEIAVYRAMRNPF